MARVSPILEHKRRDVTDQRANAHSEKDDDDQRSLEAGKEGLDADLLRVLQRNHQDKGAEDADQPRAPVERLLLLRHLPILVPDIGRLCRWAPRNDPTRLSRSAIS